MGGPDLYPKHVLGRDPGKWSAHSKDDHHGVNNFITSKGLLPRIPINLSTLEVAGGRGSGWGRGRGEAKEQIGRAHV